MRPFLPSSKITPEQDMKSQRGEYRYRSTFYSTSVLDGGGRSMPHPGQGRDPEPVLQEGGWARVGDRDSRDACRKSCPHWDSIPRPTVQPLASHYTDWAIPAHITKFKLLKY